MAGPNKILEILNDMYKVIKGKYPLIFYHEDIIKSALVYKALYYIEFGKLIHIVDVLKEFNGDINLTDPGYSCLTLALERLFGKIKYIHLNKAFHYAYGCFYKKYKKGRGYCYVLPENMTGHYMKNSPLLGYISGLIWSINHSSQY